MQSNPISGYFGDRTYVVACVATLCRQRTFAADTFLSLHRRLRRCWPDIYCYPLETLHVTLTACSPPYPRYTDITEPRIQAIKEICSAVLVRGRGPIEMEPGQVKVGANSVFLIVHPIDASAQRLRVDLTALLKSRGETPLEHRDPAHFHVNIARLLHATPTEELVLSCEMESTSIARSGRIIIDNIDLIIADQLMSVGATTHLKTFNLV